LLTLYSIFKKNKILAMKLYSFFIAFCIAAVAIIVSCNLPPTQQSANTQPAQVVQPAATVGAQAVLSFNATEDTISTSSSIDTVDFTFASIYSPQRYAFQLNADSLSGSTAATCYLQLNTDLSGADWVALETVTVNGVSTRGYETGDIERGLLRCRCISASGTQSTTVRPDLVLAPK
jgi:hypothetical protein